MRRITTLAATAAALGLGVTANAQSSYSAPDVTPVNVSVRAGVVLPFDNALKNVGKSLIGLGVEYQLPQSLLASGESYISLDYFTKSFRGDKGTVWPLCINQRFYTGQRLPGRRTYGFIGAGISFIDVDSSNTVATLRGGFGAELGENIYFETVGTLSDRAGSARANSVGFYIGYRF